MAVEHLPERLIRAGLPAYEPVVQFQRELAGHVFYTHPREQPYRWGIQASVPDNRPDQPYEDECVAFTDAVPVSYVLRQDGRIEVDGQLHARNAQVLVEGQALQFEWDVDIQPHTRTYVLRLPVRPQGDVIFWKAMGMAAEHCGLTAVEAASDGNQFWFVGPSTRLFLAPYYGARHFSNDIPAQWGALYSTAVGEVQVFHQLLAAEMGWEQLVWRHLTQLRRPGDFYAEIKS
ncbi:hypothetical protein ACFFLM_08210 [Deinococcus oregonensis]|uniref:Uncharacterized protein n=1 Tax=Deinococcus oregonensis TaxID=1805970 RepID=A0ABV6AWQ5_9DEIO